jgi:hypothetical protein
MTMIYIATWEVKDNKTNFVFAFKPTEDDVLEVIRKHWRDPEYVVDNGASEYIHIDGPYNVIEKDSLHESIRTS